MHLPGENELTHCGLVTPYDDKDWVNNGSGNGLLPDGTKPLPEPMLTYQHGLLTFIYEQFRKSYVIHQWSKFGWKSHIKNSIQISQRPMS